MAKGAGKPKSSDKTKKAKGEKITKIEKKAKKKTYA